MEWHRWIFAKGFAGFCKASFLFIFSGFCRFLKKVLQDFAKGFAGVCKRFCRSLQTVLQGSAKVFFSSVLKHFLGLLHIPAKVIAGFCKRQFARLIVKWARLIAEWARGHHLKIFSFLVGGKWV